MGSQNADGHYPMTPFTYLLVAHLAGDFLLQTGWMAANKAKHWGALFVHVIVYTLCIFVIAWLGFGGLSIAGILIIFVSHLLIDRRKLVELWVDHVMRAPKNQKNWLMIVVD